MTQIMKTKYKLSTKISRQNVDNSNNERNEPPDSKRFFFWVIFGCLLLSSRLVIIFLSLPQNLLVFQVWKDKQQTYFTQTLKTLLITKKTLNKWLLKVQVISTSFTTKDTVKYHLEFYWLKEEKGLQKWMYLLRSRSLLPWFLVFLVELICCWRNCWQWILGTIFRWQDLFPERTKGKHKLCCCFISVLMH